MPQPNVNSVHVDSVLTNISVAYSQKSNFIASQVFPVVPVDKKSNVFFTYNKNDWFRDEAQRRAGGTESVGSGYGLSTSQYSCDVFALHKDVDDQTLANSDAPLNPKRDATEFVTNRLLLRQELQFVSDYFTTGKWGANDLTGVGSAPSTNQFLKWSVANSDPIGDLEVGKQNILGTTGYEANTLVLGYEAYKVLRNHPEIIDRVKYTSSNVVTTDMLAALFEVDRVLVAKAVQATNAEGATAAYSFAYGKGALLAHVAPNPGLLTPSAGYTFAWNGVSGGLGQSIGISDFRMEHLKADRIEGEIAFDNKIVGADLGQFYTAVVA